MFQGAKLGMHEWMTKLGAEMFCQKKKKKPAQVVILNIMATQYTSSHNGTLLPTFFYSKVHLIRGLRGTQSRGLLNV